MAKLKAPLMSFGASGAIAKSMVFFPWKGLNCAREYVIPANPRTAAQTTQRGYLTDMVDRVHTAQTHDTYPLTQDDISAYALWGSTYPTPRTWFNQVVKAGIDQLVKGLRELIFSSGSTTPGAGQLAVKGYSIFVAPTDGDFWYGTSKTALIHKKAASFDGAEASATIDGLTAGVKYFWQFRPTAPASLVGARSGIYYGVPT